MAEPHWLETAFCRRVAAICLLVFSLASVSLAEAHDTWFEPRPEGDPPSLRLGTGDRFPVLESRVEFAHLQRHGCARQIELSARGAAAGRPMSAIGGPAGRDPQALALRWPGLATDAAAPMPITCWASLVPFDIEIEPAKVARYLQEIAAGPSLHAAWAAERAAGRPWLERFTKHARVEIGAASAVPLGLPMEAVLLNSAAPRVGDPLRFQLLLGGQALADHPVEWVAERSRLGIWRRTDAQGQVTLALPLAGNWLLRSTLLRPPAQPADRWHSEFVTLAFSVRPAER